MSVALSAPVLEEHLISRGPMMSRKATRKPRVRLTAASPAGLIESFFNELINHSRLQTSAEEGSKKEFTDPLILRSDGLGYPVSSEAIRIARRLAVAERTSSPEAKAQFSALNYEKLSMVALGDTISSLKEQANSAADASEVKIEAVLEDYRSILAELLKRAKMDLFRHIPCHIFHSQEINTNFEIGPVSFHTRDEWAKRYVADEAILSEVERAWKSPLEPPASKEPSGIDQLNLQSILNAIGNYGWVGTVLIQNHDAENSHEKANVLVGLALDSLNLVLPARDGALLNRAGIPFFRGGARLATSVDGHVVSGGTARLPGLGGHPGRAKSFLAETAKFREAAGHILQAYAGAHQNGGDAPWLVERWVNALHWFGEARREASDFMAVVKFGCALDIIAGAGGNLTKMTKYIEAAFGEIKATDQSGRPIALGDLINDVFNDGRSALAHGEAFGLLSDRSAGRARADVIVQQLIEQVTEPLAAVVQQRDRMLTIGKEAQVKAFQARLANLASAKKVEV